METQQVEAEPQAQVAGGVDNDRVDAPQEKPMVQLLAAIERDDHAKVARLIELGVDVNEMDEPTMSFTALTLACKLGREEIVETILNSTNVDLNKVGYVSARLVNPIVLNIVTVKTNRSSFCMPKWQHCAGEKTY